MPRQVETLSDQRLTPKKREVVVDAQLFTNPEGYSLEITSKTIQIKAATDQAVQWADRTLAQLRLPDGTYPHVSITDYPEFPIRSFMYDSGRNFVPVEVIKQYIELIARYKLNMFHWHLTDKPAWRIECRAYPELNNPAYQRIGRDAGAFYTYDQIRDVIAFAKERGVMILPEIDMPGHSDYFTATFGFSMDSPQGMQVLEACLGEFFAEIPAEDCPYLHIGSDEVHISDPAGFMRWAEGVVRAAGRKAMAWDPGLPASEETICQIWRDGVVEALEPDANKLYVDSFMGYLNYYDPNLLVNRIFLHNPCGTGHATEHALGGILCLWNDVRVIDKDKLLPHNGMPQCLLPFAERFWRGGRMEGVANVNCLPPEDSPAAAQLKAFQGRMLYHKNHVADIASMRWVPERWLTWQVRLENASSHVSPLAAFTAFGQVIDLDAQCAMQGIALPDSVRCTATTVITVPQACTVQAWVGFDMVARSNRRSDGIPRQGQWENSASLLVNGVAVAPPVWNQPGMFRFHFNTWARPEEEIPFTDEQLYWMREPLTIALQAGENEITLSLLKHFPGQYFQFAFIPIDL